MKIVRIFLYIAICIFTFSCGRNSNPLRVSNSDSVQTNIVDTNIVTEKRVEKVSKVEDVVEPTSSTPKEITPKIVEIPAPAPSPVVETKVAENETKVMRSPRKPSTIENSSKEDAGGEIQSQKQTVIATVKTKKRVKVAAKHEPVVKKKQAVLGYTYFSHMQQGESRSVKAEVVSINKNESVNKLVDSILTTLKESNAQLAPLRKSDTASYFTKSNIFFYKYVTITLIDPDSNFVINNLGIPSRQLIDTLDGNKWHWMVTPKSQVNETRLVIKVDAEREDGSQIQIDTREIPVTIVLSKNWFWTVWNWLMQNPEQFLLLILIPIAAYFGKKIFDRKKSKNEEASE